VRLYGLDTNFLVRGKVGAMYTELARWLGRLRPRDDEWVIVFGHHPYFSNGEHGGVGSYRDAFFTLWAGLQMQHFFKQYVLGRADLYLAGHDHNLQFFARTDGYDTAQVVSGSGARCNGRGGGAAHSADMERYGHGFALVEAKRDRLTVSFHDYDGKGFWGAWRTRKEPRWRALGGFPERSVDTASHCLDERIVMEQRVEPAPCEE
jgi:hypothetical protein